jgi:hypothetical protein
MKVQMSTNYEKTILNYKLWENYPQLQIMRKLSSTTNYEKTILNYKLWENYPQLQIMRKLSSTTNYEKTILKFIVISTILARPGTTYSSKFQWVIYV